MTAKLLVMAFGFVAVALAASAPARAQFFTNYPVIIVPPPPSQNTYAPQPPVPRRAGDSAAAKPPGDQTPATPRCRYMGQTRICN